jgi:hypothetical protein
MHCENTFPKAPLSFESLSLLLQVNKKRRENITHTNYAKRVKLLHVMIWGTSLFMYLLHALWVGFICCSVCQSVCLVGDTRMTTQFRSKNTTNLGVWGYFCHRFDFGAKWRFCVLWGGIYVMTVN